MKILIVLLGIYIIIVSIYIMFKIALEYEIVRKE